MMSFRERRLVQDWLADHAGQAATMQAEAQRSRHKGAYNIQFVPLRISPRVGYRAALDKGADVRLDACDEDVVMGGAGVVAEESPVEDEEWVLAAPDPGTARVAWTSRMEMATVLPEAESTTTVLGGPTTVRVSKAEPQGSTT